MKNKAFLTLTLLCLGVTSIAQVGIGTDDPKALTHIRLQPSGNGVTPNTNADELLLENNSNAGLTIATEHLGSVYFGNSDDSDLGRLSYSTEDNSMRFSTNKQERIRIDANGNVGIGIGFQYPIDSKLHIFDGGEDTRVVIQSKVEPRATASIALLGRDTQNVNSTHLFTTDIHDFVYKQGSNERMRIDSSGNVLVGTTTVGGVGHTLRGSDSAIFNRDASGETVQVKRNSSSGENIRFYNGSSITGNISTTSSSTSYSTSSDYRLKEDVQPVANASDRLMQLKPVNFAWKVDGKRVDGFLAHQVDEVVPNAVSGDKDAIDEEGNPEYQSLDHSKLVPLLTAALQDALVRIEALEQQLKNQNN